MTLDVLTKGFRSKKPLRRKIPLIDFSLDLFVTSGKSTELFQNI